MPQAQAIALQHRDAIIAEVATGAYLRTIAEKFGTSACRISDHLGKDPSYIAARESALEARLEAREEQLETAPPLMAEVSRASQLLSQARWRCEREAPHRWGAKSEVKIDATLSIAVVRFADMAAPVAAQERGSVIEGDGLITGVMSNAEEASCPQLPAPSQPDSSTP